MFIGGLINWSAFYVAPVLALHQVISKTNKQVKTKIFFLIPFSVMVFLIYILHNRILGLTDESAIDNLWNRINPLITANLYGFTYPKYIKQEIILLKSYFSTPVIFGIAGYLIFAAYTFFIQKKPDIYKSFLPLLLLYGFIPLLIFQQASFIHDYFIYYLTPFMVLSSSYFALKILKPWRKNIIYPLALIIFLSLELATSIAFTNALLYSDTNRRGYLVAQLIKKETQSGTISFITSNSYKEFQEVFIGYYSDRNIAYGEKLPKDFDKNYGLVIRPKDHDPLGLSTKQMLDSNYLRYEDENFIWYKPNLKK